MSFQQENAGWAWSSSLLPSLHRMQTEGLTTDTHLVTVGEQGPCQTPLLAHSLVLAAASPILARILATCRDQEISLILAGVEREQMEGWLEDLYLGRDRAAVFLEQWGLWEEEKRVKSDNDECLKNITEKRIFHNQMELDFDATKAPLSKLDVGNSADLDLAATEGKSSVLSLESESKTGKSEFFDSEYVINNRIIKKLQNGSYECPECSKMFKSFAIAKNHIKIVHDVTFRTCSQCPKLVRSYRFSIHMKSHTRQTKIYYCDKCNFSTFNDQTIRYHIGTHSKSKPKCDKCEKVFSNNLTLKSHIKNKHSGNVFMCDECDFTCTGPTLAAHKQMKHGPSSLICHVCEFITPLSEVLERHKAENHGSILSTLPLRKNGEKLRKERESLVNFDCEICKKILNSRQTLGLHIQSEHKGIRFNCSKEGCKFVAKQKGGLKIHLNAVHLGITHNRKLCDFKAGQTTVLRKHLMVKHDVSSFSCSSCSYRCQSSERMQKHTLQMH